MAKQASHCDKKSAVGEETAVSAPVFDAFACSFLPAMLEKAPPAGKVEKPATSKTTFAALPVLLRQKAPFYISKHFRQRAYGGPKIYIRNRVIRI